MHRTKWWVRLTGLFSLIIFLSCARGGQLSSLSTESTKPAASEQPAPKLSKWDELVAAAKKEGTVTYYMEAAQETRLAISQEFFKTYGIRVEMVVGKGAELVAKLKTERQAGLYLADLATTGEISATDLKNAGALTQLSPQIILPEAVDPKVWPDGQIKFLDKDKTIVWLTYYYQPFLLVNTDMVKRNEISSHKDLLDPKWKGKITVYDPTIAGTGPYWIVFLIQAMGQEGADRFFREIAKQDLVMTRDSRLHAESVARGKYPIGIAYSMSASGNLLSIGAPIVPNTTTEGGLVFAGSGSASIVDKAPHPNAAKLMVNWLLSREGLRVFSEAANYIPTRLDITPTWIHPALVPPEGARTFWVDEDLTQLVTEQGRDIAKNYFGHLIK